MGARSVHRKALLEALAQELPPETILFSSKLASITTKVHQDSSLAVLHMEDGTIINAKVLIGCDGVHSVVAQWLGLKAPFHSGRMAMRGLAVYPQGHGFQHRFQQFVHVGLRAGFVTLNSTDVYWYITSKSCDKGDEATKDPELLQKDVLENMAKDFPSIYLDVVQHTDLSTLTSAPLMLRFPLDLIFGPTCKGNVTVAGDAMHPMTPDLGQGGCAALEDAVVLSRHIGNSFIKDGGIRSKGIREALEGYVYESGDVGYVDDDDEVFIVDRVKELIKFKGFQVPPAELEALLISHPSIADAAVVPQKDEAAGEVPVAFVVRSNGFELTEEAVKEFIAKQVVFYKRLHKVYFVHAIPKSASGKILRKDLRAKLATGSPS